MDKSDVQGTPTPVSGPTDGDRYRQFPIRVATISAILLPMVLVPYLLTRGRTKVLRQRIDELQNTTCSLRRELNATQIKLSARKAENLGIEAKLQIVMRETDAMKHRITELTAGNVAGRKDLDHLLAEVEHSRTQTTALRTLGSSLADIAAFMHEMELQMGIEPLSRDAQRRVDRLRSSALRLQNLTVTQQRSSTSLGEEREPSAKTAGQ